MLRYTHHVMLYFPDMPDCPTIMEDHDLIIKTETGTVF